MMNAASITKVTAFLVMAGFAPSICVAQTVLDSDFSKGDFAGQGWKAKGD